jgi:hypothetical protein
VLEKLVEISFERIAATKPLDFTNPGAKLVNFKVGKKQAPRVMEEFSKMLASFKKESIPNKFEDLWMTLETLDKVTEAFDLLSSFTSAQDLHKALNLLWDCKLMP